MRRLCFCALVVFAAFIARSAPAQCPGTWRHAFEDRPSNRRPVVAYDGARHRAVLFSGSRTRGDTWEWDGAAWSLRATDGPHAREGHAMVYDPVRRVVVLYGGYQYAVQTFSDTWEWDGAQWAQRSSDGPGPRQGHAMVFDPNRGTVLLFGGENIPALGDLWEWNGTSWREVQNTVRPTSRGGAAMACDAARNVIVLFGGSSFYGDGTGEYRTDTWEWNGNTWTQVATVGPGARFVPSMVFDPTRGTVLLFGGGVNDTWLGETWEWNGVEWTRLPMEGPRDRALPATFFDLARSRVQLVLAPYNWAFAMQWELRDGAWQTVLEGGPDIGQFNPEKVHAVYDSVRDRVVWVGLGDDGVDETWEWTGSAWVRLDRGSLGGRSEFPMAFDPATARTILFGGWRPTEAFRDTWAWDGQAWTRVATSGPPSGGYFCSLGFDPARSRLVLYSGHFGNSGHTWEWTGVQWVNASTSMPGRVGDGDLVTDTVNGRLLLVEASTFTSNLALTRVFARTGMDWRLLHEGGPASGSAANVAFDARRNRVVALGMDDASYDSIGVWEFDGQRWEHVSSDVGIVTTPDDAGPLFYHAGLQRVVLLATNLGDFTTWEGPTAGQPVAVREHPVSVLRKLPGQSATFRVAAEGDGPLTYRWFWSDINIFTYYPIEGATSSELTLTDLSYTRDGYIIADVSNACGHHTSLAARLEVHCPADYLGTFVHRPDGGVTIDDLLAYLRDYLSFRPPLSADLTDGSGEWVPDGAITIDDLLFFLERYAQGC